MSWWTFINIQPQFPYILEKALNAQTKLCIYMQCQRSEMLRMNILRLSNNGITYFLGEKVEPDHLHGLLKHWFAMDLQLELFQM